MDSVGLECTQTAGAETGSASRSNASRSLSRELWQMDWDRLLPLELPSGGIVASYSSFERSKSFIEKYYASIFQEDDRSPFSTCKVNDAKARYYALTGDFVEFSHRDRVVGLFIGMPLDWSSYYIRSAAMLPEYQGTHAPQAFFRQMFPVLRAAGVERVELDVSPSNVAMMHIVTRLRFNVTGTVLSDRWGALVHFTKFLDDDSEAVFLRQFCAGVQYQLRERQ
jgi:RimJ/RimL family protein N-acetyltransferase